MKMCYDGELIMPSNSVIMNEDEMMYVEGGGWKSKIAKKIGEFIIDYVIGKGVDYVLSHKKKLWKAFLKGLTPTEATKATPYYKIFSNTCNQF